MNKYNYSKCKSLEQTKLLYVRASIAYKAILFVVDNVHNFNIKLLDMKVLFAPCIYLLGWFYLNIIIYIHHRSCYIIGTQNSSYRNNYTSEYNEFLLFLINKFLNQYISFHRNIVRNYTRCVSQNYKLLLLTYRTATHN